MTFTQGRNRLTRHFSEHILFVKRRISVFKFKYRSSKFCRNVGKFLRHYVTSHCRRKWSTARILLNFITVKGLLDPQAINQELKLGKWGFGVVSLTFSSGVRCSIHELLPERSLISSLVLTREN
jgi:hypothetical protein